VIYIALDFANLPKVRLPEMVDQIGSAVAWTYKHAKGFGGDPERIYLSGHSSGAHLVATMLTSDWGALSAPAAFVKGALCISGIYDLEAPPLSAWSADAKLTPAERAALSPQRQVDRIHCPVMIAYGDEDGPEFQRQSRDFAAALKDAGRKVEFGVAPGLNHFEILDTLGKPDGFLARMALKQIGVAA
jgi:arylformamidase